MLSCRATGPDDLDRSPHGGQRVFHLVGDDRGHFAEPGQRRLLAQPFFEPETRAEIVQDAGEMPLVADISPTDSAPGTSCRRGAP